MKNSEIGSHTAAGVDAGSRTSDPHKMYGVAIDLLMHESALLWGKFNVFLVANSIIVGGAGILLSSKPVAAILRFSIPVAGFILCLLWYFITRRGFWMCAYYFSVAQRIENTYLPLSFQILNGIYTFGHSRHLADETSEGTPPVADQRWVHKLSPRHAARIVIIVFALLHVCLFVATATRQ